MEGSLRSENEACVGGDYVPPMISGAPSGGSPLEWEQSALSHNGPHPRHPTKAHQ